ncbi:MAG: hypothetical protein BWK79_16100 [Beggiatoa sp. IS2]|nr:MAG: hypothetical protein BWK79_16100 [Beggiatoa sp. IS2]
MTTHSTILIVDDELSMRMQIESMLQEEGYTLKSVASGRELLEQLPLTPPDLILLDVVMPDLDGFEVCRRIRNDKRFQHIPIIFVTVLDSKKVLTHAMSAGADDFLQKPINKLELCARVRSLLRIKHQYDELEVALHSREELSNMIVHDMSSLITSILLHATLLKEKVIDNDTLAHLDMIYTAADHLDSFVNDMLMVAKMEQCKLRLHPNLVNVNQLILEAEKHFNIIAHSKGIQLRMELPTPDLNRVIDSNLFRRVISNLLANALQYSPPGSSVMLRLTAQENADSQSHFRLQVIDEGLGIPEKYWQRIFEKFEVVHLKHEGVSQIGLGLTFCKMAIDAHGGKIFVEPNFPQGSIFVVEI